MKTASKQLLLTSAVWCVRLLLGGAFVFSGFTKAVDPWGSIFKFEQYLASVDMSQPRSLLLAAAIILCIVEFLLGVSVMTGTFRRGAPRLTLALTTFFLILTGWIMIASPVEDCGCFGDALKLSNTATFVKNIALFAMALWLTRYNLRAGALFSHFIQWIVAVVSACYILAISLIGYLIQPLVDYRPFPEGTDLLASDDTGGLTLVYSRDGKLQEFPVDDLPDPADGWVYEGRVETDSRPVETLDISDEDGEDVTDEVIPESGELLMVIIPEYERRDVASTMYINRIHDIAALNGIDVIGIVGGANRQMLNAWKDLSMASYPLYIGDDSQLKSLARGEMSMILVKDGVIKQKISLSVISNARLQDLEKGEIDIEQLLGFDEPKVIAWLNRSYLIILLILFVLSFPQKIMGYVRRSADKKKSAANAE